MGLSVDQIPPNERLANRIIKIGSRQSKLALVQAEIVQSLLEKQYPCLTFSIVSISTYGDHVLNRPLYSFGGKALWTKELENLILAEEGDPNRIDLIVHSLKDMPTILPEGCRLGAVPKRADPRDAVIMRAGSKYKTIHDLPPGSVIGTSSIRRSAQIASMYPHFKFEDVRGNIGTRLSKLDAPDSPYACLILAASGLIRVNLGDRITQFLSYPDLMYAVGQGALGIEIRDGDTDMMDLLRPINHDPTWLAAQAERSLLRTLEGGCSVPVGVETEFLSTFDQDDACQNGGATSNNTHDHTNGDTIGPNNNILRLRARVISLDGQDEIFVSQDATIKTDRDAERLGVQAAESLKERGADRILAAINLTRDETSAPPTPTTAAANHSAAAAVAAAAANTPSSSSITS